MAHLPRLRLYALACLPLLFASCKTPNGAGAADGAASLAAAGGASGFYDINHVVQVEMTMNDWDKLRYQQPKGGHCNFQHIGPNYDWFHVNSIKVDGVSFNDVGAKKRSFCNSQSDSKPALGISFDKFNPGLKDQAMNAFGTDTLTLSNSVQDGSYARQCLAYKLFNKAGIKSPRCNFVNLKVNGKGYGIYVNIEPLKKPWFQTHYGEPLGNLYEIAGEQFEYWGLARMKGHLDAFGGNESLSDVKNVIEAIKNDYSPNLDTLGKYVDLEQVTKYWAMEVVLIHWDGFARGFNNANVYFAGDGKLRMVPWGTDQILTAYYHNGAHEDTEIFNNSNLIKKLYNSPKYMGSFKWWVNYYMDNLFKENEILADIDSMGRIVAPYVWGWGGNNETRWSTDSLKRFVRERRGKIASIIGGGGGGSTSGGINLDKICSNASSDWDHDGWGWENGSSCKVPDGGIPRCSNGGSDPDGDGWGWENNRSCQAR